MGTQASTGQILEREQAAAPGQVEGDSIQQRRARMHQLGPQPGLIPAAAGRGHTRHRGTRAQEGWAPGRAPPEIGRQGQLLGAQVELGQNLPPDPSRGVAGAHPQVAQGQPEAPAAIEIELGLQLNRIRGQRPRRRWSLNGLKVGAGVPPGSGQVHRAPPAAQPPGGARHRKGGPGAAQVHPTRLQDLRRQRRRAQGEIIEADLAGAAGRQPTTTEPQLPTHLATDGARESTHLRPGQQTREGCQGEPLETQSSPPVAVRPGASADELQHAPIGQAGVAAQLEAAPMQVEIQPSRQARGHTGGLDAHAGGLSHGDRQGQSRGDPVGSWGPSTQY